MKIETNEYWYEVNCYIFCQQQQQKSTKNQELDH